MAIMSKPGRHGRRGSAAKDEVATQKILAWLEARDSTRPAWKRVSSLARSFGILRLTQAGKGRITEALTQAGIRLDPPLEVLGPGDRVQLLLDETQAPTSLGPGSPSGRLPNQIMVWHEENMSEGDDPFGQWLSCLRSTEAGDRQFIWQGSSGRGIVALVTFSGVLRNEGAIEGWASYFGFESPLSWEALRSHPATAYRFGPRGIKALQGSAIRLSEAESEAIVDMLGGLPETELPILPPDFLAEVVPWSSVKGLPAEQFIELAIHRIRRLWRSLGLDGPPRRQETWKPVGRVDLVRGNTVIEVKKAVSVDNGPAQIERYLSHLTKRLRVGPGGVRGILVQKNDWPGYGVEERLRDSDFPLELWSVDKDADGQWQALRLV